jgi:riboflavin biosynthesis pyrimidine reductase
MRALLPRPSDDLDEEALVALYLYPTPLPGDHWLRANMVATADGAAAAQGTSRTLSSPSDQRLLGLLRALADVVVVGAQTVRAEAYGPFRPRPSLLGRRRAEGRPDSPILAIVSSRLDLDPRSTLFAQATQRPIVFTHGTASAERREQLEPVAEIVECGTTKVDLERAQQELVRRGLRRQLTEGGPHLLGQLVRRGQLDELSVTMAPLLAGAGASRIVAGPDTADPPRQMVLASLLEDDGTLFARYVREPA